MMSKRRQKRGDMFFNYGVNPFTDLTSISLEKKLPEIPKNGAIEPQKSHRFSKNSNLERTTIFEAFATDRIIKKDRNL